MAKVIKTNQITTGFYSGDGYLEVMPESRGWSTLQMLNGTDAVLNVSIGHTTPADATSYQLPVGASITLEAPSMANGPVNIKSTGASPTGSVSVIF